mmetsp:Transcript_12754/g.31492  ORF Transcript_12754/g.31492 Transcript_12754/m.31492 type:complete len:281 (-) Transcript_12754:1494-2336(-)
MRTRSLSSTLASTVMLASRLFLSATLSAATRTPPASASRRTPHALPLARMRLAFADTPPAPASTTPAPPFRSNLPVATCTSTCAASPRARTERPSPPLWLAVTWSRCASTSPPRSVPSLMPFAALRDASVRSMRASSTPTASASRPSSPLSFASQSVMRSCMSAVPDADRPLKWFACIDTPASASWTGMFAWPTTVVMFVAGSVVVMRLRTNMPTPVPPTESVNCERRMRTTVRAADDRSATTCCIIRPRPPLAHERTLSISMRMSPVSPAWMASLSKSL